MIVEIGFLKCGEICTLVLFIIAGTTVGFERDEYITTEHNGSVVICAVLYPTNTPGAHFTVTLVLLEGSCHRPCSVIYCQ